MIVNKISAESTDLPTCHYSSYVLIGSIFISCVYRLSDGRKILFHEYDAKLINPENPPLPHKICTLAQDHKAWKRMEVNSWHHWEPP